LIDHEKLVWFVTVSLDGYFEGPNHDISWHNVDDEFNGYAVQQLQSTDTILFGRRTYQLFEEYWSKAEDDPAVSKYDLQIARMINNMKKIVYSKTLTSVEEHGNWKNVSLERVVVSEKINALKRLYGKDVSVGGNMLGVSLSELGLIDEYRIMLNPVVLGASTTLFRGIKERLKLELLETRRFRSGNVLLTYKPISR